MVVGMVQRSEITTVIEFHVIVLCQYAAALFHCLHYETSVTIITPVTYLMSNLNEK